MTSEETIDVLLAALRTAQHEVETSRALADYWQGRADRADGELARDRAKDVPNPEWVGGHE